MRIVSCLSWPLRSRGKDEATVVFLVGEADGLVDEDEEVLDEIHWLPDGVNGWQARHTAIGLVHLQDEESAVVHCKRRASVAVSGLQLRSPLLLGLRTYTASSGFHRGDRPASTW